MNSTTKAWIEAARLRTLPAAFAPVLIGASIAYADNQLNTAITLIAVVCALLIQIGTNFANDYYDFKKGADTSDRIGFARASASGSISPEIMRNATWLTMALAFVTGLYLVYTAGWIILVIGVFSILFGIAYTGGPYPLAYNGLGDIFVFIFFGFVAVIGTYYINTLELSTDAFWASIAAGALTTSILVVNNLRDSESDRKVGKNTLGVKFGDRFLKFEYLILMMLAYSIPPHFRFQEGYSNIVLLPMMMLPLAAVLVYRIWTNSNKHDLNNMLGQTAAHLLLFSILFAAGIILD
ncbi:MAG: 1,4-dihydroxy-2-naphthoate polyprenyltransferase [Cyclonatronaceae bacterium]